MIKALFSVKKIKSAEQWYCATAKVNGIIVTGFGTTHALAVEDAKRSYDRALSLATK